MTSIGQLRHMSPPLLIHSFHIAADGFAMLSDKFNQTGESACEILSPKQTVVNQTSKELAFDTLVRPMLECGSPLTDRVFHAMAMVATTIDTGWMKWNRLHSTALWIVSRRIKQSRFKKRIIINRLEEEKWRETHVWFSVYHCGLLTIITSQNHIIILQGKQFSRDLIYFRFIWCFLDYLLWESANSLIRTDWV